MLWAQFSVGDEHMDLSDLITRVDFSCGIIKRSHRDGLIVGKDSDALAFHFADDAQHLSLLCLLAELVGDGIVDIEALGEGDGEFCPSRIRRYDADVIHAIITFDPSSDVKEEVKAIEGGVAHAGFVEPTYRF